MASQPQNISFSHSKVPNSNLNPEFQPQSHQSNSLKIHAQVGSSPPSSNIYLQSVSNLPTKQDHKGKKEKKKNTHQASSQAPTHLHYHQVNNNFWAHSSPPPSCTFKTSALLTPPNQKHEQSKNSPSPLLLRLQMRKLTFTRPPITIHIPRTMMTIKAIIVTTLTTVLTLHRPRLVAQDCLLLPRQLDLVFQATLVSEFANAVYVVRVAETFYA